MMRVPLCGLLVVALVAAVSLDASTTPPEFEELKDPADQRQRLPRNVQPLKYNVELDFSHAFEGSNSLTKYRGSMTIDVAFFGVRRKSGVEKGAARLFGCTLGKCVSKQPQATSGQPQDSSEGEPNEIVMHADRSVIVTSIEVLNESGKPMKIKKLAQDKTNQVIVIQMAKDLPRDGLRGQIKINFGAPIRTDRRGVYYSIDTSNGHNFRHVVAKFQPTFARLAMPCFDEPSFKAVFDLQIKHKSSLTAYANAELEERQPTGESDMVKSVFEPTPRMPIHMLAFAVGDFDPNPLTVQVRPDLTLRYLSVPGSAHKGMFALGVARKAVAWCEQYVDNQLHLDKLDLVAISDTDADTTETWGLVFLRDFLVAHDQESQPFSRISIAVRVAHLVAQQWFANLVTAKWWDDMWITEGVTALMALEMVAELYPDFESEYAFQIDTLSSALEKEESGEPRSLASSEDKLSSLAKIRTVFDQKTFAKSGSLVRSLQNLLGHDQLRHALRLLAAKFAYKNFEFSDFLECIERTADPGQSIPAVERILRSFSVFPGFPVLNVDVGGHLDKNDGHLIVYTEPVDKAGPVIDTKLLYEYSYVDQHVSEHPWSTPLHALISDGGERQEVVPVKFGATTIALADMPEWFDPEKHYLKLQPKPDYSTYYRVRYTDKLLRQLHSPIAQKQLTPMDRVHILDDADALVKLHLISNDAFRELFDSYANEDSFPVIWVMLRAARTLSQLTVTSTTRSASLEVFPRLFRKYGFKVSGAETLVEQRARSETLKELVIQGDQQVIDEALKAFKAGSVALFLREPVYAAVVKAGSSDQIEQLVRHMKETDSYEEKFRLASALARSKDKEVLSEVMEFVYKHSGFKPQALVQVSGPLDSGEVANLIGH